MSGLTLALPCYNGIPCMVGAPSSQLTSPHDPSAPHGVHGQTLLHIVVTHVTSPVDVAFLVIIVVD